MERKQTEEKQHYHDDSHHEKVPPKQFHGLHMGVWVNLLPSSWIPFIRLARLIPPVPVLLIFFPHVFGLIHAAVIHEIPSSSIIRTCYILLGGSFFLSNAIHAWNDLIDSPIDKLVPRTRNRPIPQGVITPRAAFVFTVSQAVAAACCLLLLPRHTMLYAIPGIISHTYYPFSKRHTYFPQVVLAISLQWPILLASSAAGVHRAWTDKSLLCLFLGSVIWTVIYDTIYGFQDYKDDIRIGVKSTAVLFGKWGKPILWFLSNVLVALILVSGCFGEMSLMYFVPAVGGCFASLNFMMVRVDLQSPVSCSWWFTYGFWGPAGSISGGLLCEYFYRYSTQMHEGRV